MSNRVGKKLNNIRLRLHALTVMFIVVWAGYAAVSYLFKSVFQPAVAPAQFSEATLQFDAESLRQGGFSDPDLTERVPAAHYHSLDRRFAPDSMIGCTTEGCHSLLPHTKTEILRTFNNFHTSFLGCQTCHEYSSNSTTQLQWVNINTGEAQETPALLKLMDYLETSQPEISADPAGAHTIIVDLLKQILLDVDPDPLLDTILLQLTTSIPGSGAWKNVIIQLNIEIPELSRGEYGAKLTVIPGEEENVEDTERAAELIVLIDLYQATGSEMMQREIRNILHTPLLKNPHKCMVCHNRMGGFFDFAKFGYSPQRTDTLKKLPIATQMMRIR